MLACTGVKGSWTLEIHMFSLFFLTCHHHPHPSTHSFTHYTEPHNRQPQTIPRRPHWKIRPRQAQVGPRVPGRTRLLRCIHEPPTHQNRRIHQWTICRDVRGSLDSLQQCLVHQGCATRICIEIGSGDEGAVVEMDTCDMWTRCIHGVVDHDMIRNQ
jgi:hypothetical protein